MRFARVLILLALVLMPRLATAQMAASLVANQIEVSQSGNLVASGNVEVFYDGTRLSAARILFDPEADRLRIEGPIFIQTSDGLIFTATEAELGAQLRNGILLGARFVIDQKLQLAANQIDRVDGRYTQLYKVSASSCAVCGNREPLWEIRAQKVVHDQDEQQLYFDNATFRVRGVPIFWLPTLRMPDPTLERATGLLVPRVRSTNLLGLGIKLPYFIVFGDHRDLTLTPYVSPETFTLEARYRQAYMNGDLEVTGALSSDQLRPGAPRGYIFANGSFDLSNDYRLRFQTQLSSDEGYLLDYGYSTKDRLESHLILERYSPTTAVEMALIAYQGLLPVVTNESTPPLLAEASYRRLLYPDRMGGRLELTGALDAHWRPTAIGGTRDVARIAAGAAWDRSWITDFGLVARVATGAEAELYATNDDPLIDSLVTRITPTAQAELRWPFAATTARGITHIVEPIVALNWSETYGGDVANEDSTRVELDEGNLFSAAHYPGDDGREGGPRMAYGVSWSHFDGGNRSQVMLGRVYSGNPSAFSKSSGLSTAHSDWLVAGQMRWDNGLSITGRTLLSADFVATKTEARIDWTNDKVDLGASYVWLDVDVDEDRTDSVSEWAFDASYQINPAWQISLDGRYDVAGNELAQAGAGVVWRNECVTVELSASRRYTSSISVDPSTDVRLEVELSGFSAGRSGLAPQTHCTN